MKITKNILPKMWTTHSAYSLSVIALMQMRTMPKMVREYFLLFSFSFSKPKPFRLHLSFSCKKCEKRKITNNERSYAFNSIQIFCFAIVGFYSHVSHSHYFFPSLCTIVEIIFFAVSLSLSLTLSSSFSSFISRRFLLLVTCDLFICAIVLSINITSILEK